MLVFNKTLLVANIGCQYGGNIFDAEGAICAALHDIPRLSIGCCMVCVEAGSMPFDLQNLQ